MRPKRVVRVRVARRVRADEVVRLYRAAGWWREEYSSSPARIGAMVRGSLCFVGAFRGRRMVGMGRAISDGAGDAYLQDVTVLPAWRGRGIGRAIILKLLDVLRGRGIEWIGLIAEPGHGRFYHGLGFRELKRCTPMVWRERR
ncbi:MAG: GNAT family N-acetyltransferase [bacterium]|nr:GNAT family N-acetyltransferase [bacterium]